MTIKKKTSSRQKGSAYELEVQKHLEAQGYTCHRAYASTYQVGNKRFNRSNDIFNVVDIIAKRQGENTRWIQVSTGSRRAEKENKLKSIGNIWNDTDSVELWLRFRGKIWKIYRYQKGEFEEVAKIERGKYFEIQQEG